MTKRLTKIAALLSAQSQYTFRRGKGRPLKSLKDRPIDWGWFPPIVDQGNSRACGPVVVKQLIEHIHFRLFGRRINVLYHHLHSLKFGIEDSLDSAFIANYKHGPMLRDLLLNAFKYGVDAMEGGQKIHVFLPKCFKKIFKSEIEERIRIGPILAKMITANLKFDDKYDGKCPLEEIATDSEFPRNITCHAFIIVDLVSVNGHLCFKCRNTRGLDWGDQGHFYVKVGGLYHNQIIECWLISFDVYNEPNCIGIPWGSWGAVRSSISASQNAKMETLSSTKAKHRLDEIQDLKMRLQFQGIQRLEEHLQQIEVLRARVGMNQEVTRFAMENLRLKDEVRRLKSFTEEGELEMMNEQIKPLQKKLLVALDCKHMDELVSSTVQTRKIEADVGDDSDLLLPSTQAEFEC